MNFFEKDTYSQEDVRSLIVSEKEEDLYLDYKSSGALSKEDKKKIEITKDVSSFANSDGGVIIYGISEKDHKPQEITYIDGCEYTKEWLENCIQSIQPKIEDLKIYPIRFVDISKSVYIVKIPRSNNAPHMAKDNRYYRRYNFKSVPMEDYEVKDTYNRILSPNLDIDNCAFYIESETKDEVVYILRAAIVNKGNRVCDLYKLNFYLNNLYACNVEFEQLNSKYSYTVLSKNRFKFSFPASEPIFPKEQLDLGNIRFRVKKICNLAFYNGLVVDMVLLFSGGVDEVAYIPSCNEFISNREDIDLTIKQKNKETKYLLGM